MQVTTRKDMQEILDMLNMCNEICILATVSFTNIKNHPGYERESLPELLRAQMQNATALVSQAMKIWSFMLAEQPSHDA